ncbi:putative restriction endonuclease [Escherichia coli]|nr:putative restriction endonuclease [Escherichia coli]
MASEPSETNAITGDGGIDGQVIIGKYRYLIQAKRYRGHIALQHVQEFEKLLKRHNCPRSVLPYRENRRRFKICQYCQ